MSVSDKLKLLRLAQGLSQAELAEKIGLSMHSINSYESDRREPNSKAMAALERYFNVSGAYLRGEEESDVARDFEFDKDSEQDPVAAFMKAYNKMNKAYDKSVANDIAAILNAGDSTLLILQMARIFMTLSKEGQEEMFKRIGEYAIVDKKNQKAKNAQKKDATEEDSMATYTIAARGGTRIIGKIPKELRDEIRELPSEDLGF